MTDITAERLAKAMHDSDKWPVRKGEQPHVWERCNEEHQSRYIELANRYLSELVAQDA